MGAGTASRFDPGLADQTCCPTTQGRWGRDRSLRLRLMGQGPLAALAFDVNSTTQLAAKQAGFAPHDLVS
jgi:hypothetical protein